MRRPIALAASILLAAGAAIAPAGGTALAAGLPVTAGQVCVQQNGVYLANVRYQVYETGAFRASSVEKLMAMGQSFCQEYYQTDAEMNIFVHVVLGNSQKCQIKLAGRSGVLNVVTSGTSLDVRIACP